MPRRSLRNLFPALRSADVDVSGAGARVSDDIQMTYQMGDLTPYSYSYYGAGGFILGAPARVALMQLEIRGTNGVIIELANWALSTVTGYAWIDPTPAAIAGATVGELGFSEGKPPESIFTKGTLLGSEIPGSGLSGFLSYDGNDRSGRGLGGLYIRGVAPGVGKFLKMVNPIPAAGTHCGLRWREAF